MTVVIRATDIALFELLMAGWVVTRSFYYGRIPLYILSFGERS